MNDVRIFLHTVNQNIENPDKNFTYRVKNPGELSVSSTLAPSGKNVKTYLLKDSPASCELGSEPHFTPNPYTGLLDITWKKCETPYWQRVNGGGMSSGKLFRCGLSWRHVTYFDNDGRPMSFPFGYTAGKSDGPEDAIDDPLAQWFKEYDARQTLKQAGFLDADGHPVDSGSPAPSHDEPERLLGDGGYDRAEFLEQERQRDKLRRKRQQKNRCRDIVNKNYLNYMYTLTFALEENANVYGLRFILPEEQQRDRAEVEKAWNKRRGAIRKELQRLGIDFRYVKVLERHDSEHTDPRKRLTFHIHLATDAPIGKTHLQFLWGFGVVWVDDFNKSKETTEDGQTVLVERDGCVLSPGDYMSKYMEKDFDEADELGKRAYSPSKNLRPVRPDKVDAERKALLQHPAFGFDSTDRVQIDAIEPGLLAKITALSSVDEVKVFDAWCQVKFQRIDKQTGTSETVSFWIHYDYYNFRVLMKNATFRRKFPKNPAILPPFITQGVQHETV